MLVAIFRLVKVWNYVNGLLMRRMRRAGAVARLAVYLDLQLNIMVIWDPVSSDFRTFLLDSPPRLVFSLYMLWNMVELLFVRGITVERNPLVFVPDRSYRKQYIVLVFTVIRVKELCISRLGLPWQPTLC